MKLQFSRLGVKVRTPPCQEPGAALMRDQYDCLTFGMNLTSCKTRGTCRVLSNKCLYASLIRFLKEGIIS